MAALRTAYLPQIPSLPANLTAQNNWTHNQLGYRTYTVEGIGDTGAGRNLGSTAALVAQGVPKEEVEQAIVPASEDINFDTAGGEMEGNKAVQYNSNTTGSQEMCMLENSPIAFSIGMMVLSKNMPFLWIPGQLPYLVTRPDKLTVKVDERFKVKADRVEQYVPIFKEQIVL